MSLRIHGNKHRIESLYIDFYLLPSPLKIQLILGVLSLDFSDLLVGQAS